MKYNFAILIVILLICACSSTEKKDKKTVVTKDENKEKVATKLVGQWIFDDYLKEIEKTKKIFGNDKYGNSFIPSNLGFDLNFDNLMSDSAYIFQFNVHEGGGGCPIFFNQKKQVFESKEYETDGIKKEAFEINQTDANLLLFKFKKSGKTMTYRKVSDFDNELRRILFEGKYKNLKDNSDVAFFKDGKVIGIEGRHYFEVFYDFTFENMDVMAIQKDIELSSRQSYHFKINADKLKIYNLNEGNIEDEDDKNDEPILGELWLSLLKQK